MKRRFLVAAIGAAVLAVSVTGGGTALAQSKGKINPNARLEFGLNMSGGGFSQRLQPNQMTAVCDSIVGSQPRPSASASGSQSSRRTIRW